MFVRPESVQEEAAFPSTSEYDKLIIDSVSSLKAAGVSKAATGASSTGVTVTSNELLVVECGSLATKVIVTIPL
jgi:hypothetical protein